jgi:phosphatidylinositol alpha-1,6-mannosyltransferase
MSLAGETKGLDAEEPGTTFVPGTCSPGLNLSPDDRVWHAISCGEFAYFESMRELDREETAAPPADLVLVTEIFPPGMGGSAQLFSNAYSRLRGTPVTVLTPVAGAAERATGLRVVRSKPSRSWGLLHPRAAAHHARLAWTIRRLARGRRAVVHCGRILPEGMAAFLSHLSGGPPYVCWAHGEELAYFRESRELTALATRVLGRASSLIANSRNTARLLEQFGGVEERVRVIYPGVDPDLFRPDASGAQEIRARFVPHDGQLMLTVGRLQRRKGHDVTIRALATLRERLPGLHYVIAGDGEERARLTSLAREHGVEQRVSFVGNVSACDLPRYYAAADFFVHPNRIEQGDFEGFGMVFLEAAAAGLPVIAGRSGGAPEAVSENVTALLVSGTDVGELSDAVCRLSESSEMRSELGAAGRLRAVQHFTWESTAAHLAELHDSIPVR